MLAIAIVHKSHSEVIQGIARQFEELTVAAGFHFRKVGIPREAFQILEAHPELANPRTLILWCTRRVDIEIPETIASFIKYKKDCEVIIYADDAHWSGNLAVSCIKNGASDYLVDGIHHGLFQGQVGKLVTGGNGGGGHGSYGRYKLNLIPRVSMRKKVFIAAPYLPASDHDWEHGIKPALNHLGVQPFESDSEHGTGYIWDKIKKQIDESAFVIANTTRYGGHHNPNVALEIGYAMRRLIKPIIIHHVGDDIFADLSGIETLRYHHCSDLAVQLYYGLRDCIV